MAAKKVNMAINVQEDKKVKPTWTMIYVHIRQFLEHGNMQTAFRKIVGDV